ncbi:MAG TPA: hypothetical protein VFH56_10175 [Acidimicrobiales bacterium]|nr:hypothetical protein [Acidimicrobiales bacterium]
MDCDPSTASSSGVLAHLTRILRRAVEDLRDRVETALWYALNSVGTGDYHGSDCGHGIGAVADAGDVTWHQTGNNIEIDGTVLAGLGNFPATVTVPAAYGHYTGTLGSYITLPGFIPPQMGFFNSRWPHRQSPTDHLQPTDEMERQRFHGEVIELNVDLAHTIAGRYRGRAAGSDDL